MKPFSRATAKPISPEQMRGFRRLAQEAGMPEQELERLLDKIKSEEIFMNDLYQVNVRPVDTPAGPMVHLSIKRIDKEPIHDWRELQQIKNMLVGPENEAVELYPAESRLVDTANQYHLWVVADSGFRWPWGFTERLVKDKDFGTGSKQRPLKEKK